MTDRSDTQQLKLSIAIPAYNEEAVILATLEALKQALTPQSWSFELVIADDGSTDRTWELLTAAAAKDDRIRPVKNIGPGGYGMAVRCALDAAEGDAVIVAMADGSDPPEDVVSYATALFEEGYDCAFGSRFGNPERVKGYPPFKRVLNRVANRIIAWLTGRNYDDFTNGFKGYRRATLEAMQPLVCADFNLTVEMSMKALQTGAQYKVIPNGWLDREGGVSKFNIPRLAPRYVAAILYCWLLGYLRQAGARPRV